jgi:hypothetical protein
LRKLADMSSVVVKVLMLRLFAVRFSQRVLINLWVAYIVFDGISSHLA